MTSDSPLLVIGAGRGGTSLLAACLDGHPNTIMRSEFHHAVKLVLATGEDRRLGASDVQRSMYR